MFPFLLRRLVHLVPVVFGVSVIVFLMIHLIPGDPAQLIAGPEATADDIAVVRVQLGLDRPLPVQYATFVGRALTGNLGTSFRTGRPVSEEIGERYWNTVSLGIVAVIFGTLLGLGVGLITAVYRGGWVDNLVLGISLLGISVPSFFLGISLMLLFAVELELLPLTGMGTWKHYILPAATLGIPNAAVIARIARASLIEVLEQDYVRTARAKGLPNIVVVIRHALRNALIPVVTVAALQMGYLLGGAVVTETVFAWPGVGRLIIQSIGARDFPVVQAAVLLLALTFVLVNLISDVLYRVVDPRIELK
jgi:glutathione transport system permease protein